MAACSNKMPPRQRDDGIMWHSRLKNLPKLYSQHTPQTAYVAIDFEAQNGGRHSGVYQMGVAVLPPSAILRHDDAARGDKTAESDDTDDADDCGRRLNNAVGYALPDLAQDPAAMMAQNQIESYSFHTLNVSHPRSDHWQRRRERLCLFGDEIRVDTADMDAQLLALLTAIRDRFRDQLGPGAPPVAMVLVAYAMGMENKMLHRHCPTVAGSDLFTHWCDLQLVVGHVSGRNALGLVDALLALGAPFGPLAPASGTKQHQAGNDVVRTLVVLLHLLHHAAQTEAAQPSGGRVGTLPHPFQHACREGGKHAGSPKRGGERGPLEPHRLGQGRPRPYSAYPFTVGVNFASSDYIVSAARHPAELQAYFAEYRPVAVTMHRDRIGGWVCLATAEERDRFVAEVDGKVCGEQVWKVRILSPEINRKRYTPQGQLTRHARRTQRDSLPVQSRRLQWRAELAAVDQDLSLGVDWMNLEDSSDGM